MKTTMATLAVAGMFLASCAPEAPPHAQPAPAPPAHAPQHQAPDQPPRQPVAAQHTVTVRVTGPLGSVFQVAGAVFGNTGPITMPDGGADTASFNTENTDDLGLTVSVLAGPDPRTCVIEVDGTPIVRKTAMAENPVTCKATRAV